MDTSLPSIRRFPSTRSGITLIIEHEIVDFRFHGGEELPRHAKKKSYPQKRIVLEVPQDSVGAMSETLKGEQKDGKFLLALEVQKTQPLRLESAFKILEGIGIVFEPPVIKQALTYTKQWLNPTQSKAAR